MPLYNEMYNKLFRQVTKTIAELQQVQQECEQIYMNATPNATIKILENQDSTLNVSDDANNS